MSEKDDLTREANKTALDVIVESGEFDLVRSMAAWLTLECATRKGDSQSAAQARIGQRPRGAGLNPRLTISIAHKLSQRRHWR